MCFELVRAAEQQQGRLLAFRACELPSHGAYFTHANCRQLHLAAVVARAHEAPRPVVPLRRHRGFGRYPASSLPTTAPTKCLRPLDPLVSFPVAPEATRGQRFAVLHLTEEPSWVIRTRELEGSPSIFFFVRFGRPAPDATQALERRHSGALRRAKSIHGGLVEQVCACG